MKGRIAIGAVVGAVAGVVAGMLTAPKSGKETRADLKTRAEELKQQADTATRNVKKSTEDLATQATDKVRGAIDNAKRNLNK